MLITKNTLHKIIILGVATLLITCGGGGGGSVPKPAAEIFEGTITGVASLGPIVNGTVTAYNFSSGSRGEALNPAVTKTANDGAYTIKLKMKDTPILVCIENGEYTEAASVGMNPIQFGSFVDLCAITIYKTGNAQTISISYYTHLAYGYAISLMAQGIAVETAITQANNALSTWIGIDIISTIPFDITNVDSASTTLSGKHKYGFANAALSSLVKELATTAGQSEFSSITSIAFSKVAFDDVKNDGRLNGKSDTGIVEIGTVVLTKDKYRNILAKNILTMAGSAQNQSLITNNNPDLIVYSNAVTGYDGSIFQPITGPIIQITSQNELGLITGNVTFSATIIDSVKLKSVVFSLLDANGTVMTPSLPIPTDLGNASISFDSTLYPDGVYTVKVDAINSNNLASTKQKGNLYINNTGANTANIAPIAKADTYDLTIGDPDPEFIVLGNDNDPDAGPSRLTVVLDSPSTTAKGSTVKLNTAQTGFIYTPSATMTVDTVDVFSYYAFDGKAKSNIVNVTVTATLQANRNPVAQDINTTAVAKEAKQILLIGSDLDSDQLTVVIDSKPANATVIEGFGQFVSFTGATAGNTSFTYHFTDGRGGISNTATVSINVSAARNTAPVANPDVGNVAVGGSVITIDVLLNDSDDVTLTKDLILVSVTQPLNSLGLVSKVGNKVVYKSPLLTASTSVQFNYTVSDGVLSTVGTVTVTLGVDPNTAPVATNDSILLSEIFLGVVPIQVLANDTDAETPNSLRIIKINGTTPTARGFLLPSGIVSINSIDGRSLSYKSYSGGTIEKSVSFTYTITDGKLPSTATVTINFFPRPPTARFFDQTSIGGIPVSLNVFVSRSGLALKRTGKPIQGKINIGAINADNSYTVTYTPPFSGIAFNEILEFVASNGVSDSKPYITSIRVSAYKPLKRALILVSQVGTTATYSIPDMRAGDTADGSIVSNRVNGFRNFKFTLSGGTGDADLKFTTYAGTVATDTLASGIGVNRSILIPKIVDRYATTIIAKTDRKAVTYVISWELGKALPAILTNGVGVTGLWGSKGFSTRTKIVVPSGQRLLRILFSDNSSLAVGNFGVAYVYEKFGVEPTNVTGGFDKIYGKFAGSCRQGICEFRFDSPAAGTYHILFEAPAHTLGGGGNLPTGQYEGKFIRAEYCVSPVIVQRSLACP